MTKKELVEALKRIDVYYECKGNVKNGKIVDYSIFELLEIIKNLTNYRKIKKVSYIVNLNNSSYKVLYDELENRIYDVEKDFTFIKSSVAYCDISLTIERITDDKMYSFNDIIKIEHLLHINFI